MGNTGYSNTGYSNTGDSNTGNRNTGYKNSGNYNTGNYNTGDYNTGNYNTGNYNTGDYNSGHSNTGNYNTGNRNSGDSNSGYSNTGYRNTGDYNSGHSNTGYRNTGDYNSGDSNSGDYNSGDYNSGNCNTTTPKLRLFNKECDWEFNSEKHIRFKNIIYEYQLPLCEWVSKSNMSEEEINNNPTCETTNGYLRVNKKRRNNIEMSKEDREFLLAVPNFDKDIFLECTGIDIDCNRVKIIVDGKEYFVSKDEIDMLINERD